MKQRKHEHMNKFELIWKKIKYGMEKRDTITKKACKKQASFENKGASIA